MTSLHAASDAAFQRAQPPIEVRFIGGHLAGNVVTVAQDKGYEWTDKASGDVYRRICQPHGRELRYYFVLPAMLSAERDQIIAETLLK